MATRKFSGLGKGIDSMGIDALIPNRTVPKAKVEEEEKDVSRETLININLIEPNREQPRKKFDEDALQELSESIKQFGIIQPLVLQKRDKYYEIIAGERRWRAAKLAGLKEVPAIVKEYTEKEIVEIALIENIQRENLNPIEEAMAYQRLIQEFNLKQDELSERVAKSRAAIANSMRLLKLDSRVQSMLMDGLITSGHARALLPIMDGEMQYELANQILDGKLSVRETENLIKKFIRDLEETTNSSEEEKREKVLDENVEALYKEMEENIKNIIGTKVAIKRKDENRGKIEIEYYTEEELERLYDMLRNMNK